MKFNYILLNGNGFSPFTVYFSRLHTYRCIYYRRQRRYVALMLHHLVLLKTDFTDAILIAGGSFLMMRHSYNNRDSILQTVVCERFAARNITADGPDSSDRLLSS